MNLDEQDRFHEFDPEGMLAEIDGLPNQLQSAWDLGRSLPLPVVEGIRQVVIAGMGGSAIGGDLLAAYVAPFMSIPVIVWRNYDLPAYASGPGTLVITSSHSGNTEETLSAFERGRERGVSLMAIAFFTDAAFLSGLLQGSDYNRHQSCRQTFERWWLSSPVYL